MSRNKTCINLGNFWLMGVLEGIFIVVYSMLVAVCQALFKLVRDD
jgi:hypothetical protein